MSAITSVDWEAVQKDVLCPLCDYNLRGLTEPRCPECGYRFEWPDVLDPSRRIHSYVFEHHPDRNMWSFWKTLLGGLRPRRFWLSLHPAQPYSPRRLVLYWLIYSSFTLVAVLLAVSWMCVETSRRNRVSRPIVLAQAQNGVPIYWHRESFLEQFDSIEQYVDLMYPVDPIPVIRHVLSWLGGALILISLLMISWPWLSVLAMSVFGISMRHARVRPIHICRSALYSFDHSILVGVSIILSVGGIVTRQLNLQHFFLILPIIYMIVLIVYIYRLCVAYTKYLQFHWPIPVVLTSQFLLCLALFVVFMHFSMRSF